MLQAKNMTGREIIFTHFLDGVTRHFVTSSMEADIHRVLNRVSVDAFLDGRADHPEWELIVIGIDLKFAEHIRTERGIEQHRLKPLMGMGHAEFVTNVPPPLFIHEPGGHHTLVDGHHRYLAAADSGFDKLLIVSMSHSFASKYQVAGLSDTTPEELAASFSGIPAHGGDMNEALREAFVKTFGVPA